VAAPAASAPASRPRPAPARPAEPAPAPRPSSSAPPLPAAEAPPPSLPSAPVAAPVAAPVRESPLSFGDVKLVVTGADGKVKENDVILKLEDGRVWAMPRNGEPRSMPYQIIASAIYSQSKHPRWKEGIGVAIAAGIFSAPIFFMKSTRHWLTLQAKEDYMVFHLDKNNVNLILPAFESHSGVKVQRLEGDK
jgi:hypothetical protein